MIAKLQPASDPRAQLEAAGVWERKSELKLAIFGVTRRLPGYVYLAPEGTGEAAVTDFSIDLKTVKFPQMSVNEVLILEGFSELDPASAIAFLSTCTSWLTINGHLTLQVPLGRWKFPNTERPVRWDRATVIALLDYLGLIFGYIKENRTTQGDVLVASAIRGERRVALPSRFLQLQRLIEGPLCSEGLIPPRYTETFYNQCLAFLDREPVSEPPISLSFHTPAPQSGKLAILHTAEFYAPHVGGAELVVGQISERLAARGHSVTVATTRLPERKEEEINGVSIQGFDVRGSAAIGIHGPDVRKYMQFLLQFPCDVMMNYAAQQWATDLALPLVCRVRHRVNVLAPCGFSAMESSGLVRLREFFNYFKLTLPGVIQDYDVCVYHSKLYHDYQFAQRIKATNDFVIPNAADEAEFSTAPHINFREKYGIKDKYILLYVANFLEGKGQDRALEVFRSLGRPDTALIFIGKNGETLEATREKAQGLNVHFLVDIPRIDTISAFFASDLFLFCSTVEASPLVILESKAARLPFLSTDVGNVREWKGGLISKPETMHEFIHKLLDSPQTRTALGYEGWVEYQERHTWSKVVDSYEDLYLRLHHAKVKAVSGL